MNDQELDQLLRQAQPASAGRAPAVAPRLREGGQELLEEIMSTSQRAESSEPVTLAMASRKPVNRRPSRRRILLVGAGSVLAVAAAVVAVIVVPRVVFAGNEPVIPASRPTPVSALSPSPSVASVPTTSNPYVLVNDPGWKLDHVQEEDWGNGLYGESRYVNGPAKLQISWDPKAGYRQEVGDNTDEYGAPASISLFDGKALLFDQQHQEFTVLVKRGGRYFTIQGNGAPDLDAYRQWLGRLSLVTAEQWYAAMPDWVVTPDRTAVVAAKILQDVPVPEKFDTSVLTDHLTRDLSQFVAQVTGRVTCAWLDDYAVARKSGDEAGMAAVDEALGNAANWKYIKSDPDVQDYGKTITEYAGKVAERVAIGGYKPALGCDR